MVLRRYDRTEVTGMALAEAEGHTMVIDQLMGVIKEARSAKSVQRFTLFGDVQNTEISQ